MYISIIIILIILFCIYFPLRFLDLQRILDPLEDLYLTWYLILIPNLSFNRQVHLKPYLVIFFKTSLKQKLKLFWLFPLFPLSSLTGKYLYEKYHLKCLMFIKKKSFVFIINMKFFGIQYKAYVPPFESIKLFQVVYMAKQGR